MATESDPIKIKKTSDLGSLIKARRKALGFTQVHASGLAGVGARFIAELEKGKPTAELGKVLQVLELLGLDLWLVPRERGKLG